MSKYELKLTGDDAVLLTTLLEERERDMFNELVRRHLLRKDGELSQIKKYKSEYEIGLLEDYYRIKRLATKTNRFMMLEVV